MEDSYRVFPGVPKEGPAGSTLLSITFVAAYLNLRAIHWALNSLSSDGGIGLLSTFITVMLALSLAFVYLRRITLWLEPTFGWFWRRITVEGDRRVRSFPSFESIANRFFQQFHSPSSDIVEQRKNGKAAATWLLVAILFQMIMILIVLLTIERGRFEEIVNTYQSGRTLLITSIAIINAVAAVLFLILQSISTTPDAGAIIFFCIGVPALLASPGVRNLMEVEEFVYLFVIEKITNLVPIDRFEKWSTNFIILVTLLAFELVFPP